MWRQRILRPSFSALPSHNWVRWARPSLSLPDLSYKAPMGHEWTQSCQFSRPDTAGATWLRTACEREHLPSILSKKKGDLSSFWVSPWLALADPVALPFAHSLPPGADRGVLMRRALNYLCTCKCCFCNYAETQRRNCRHLEHCSGEGRAPSFIYTLPDRWLWSRFPSVRPLLQVTLQ